MTKHEILALTEKSTSSLYQNVLKYFTLVNTSCSHIQLSFNSHVVQQCLPAVYVYRQAQTSGIKL